MYGWVVAVEIVVVIVEIVIEVCIVFFLVILGCSQSNAIERPFGEV